MPITAKDDHHLQRRMAESFGSDAERYDRARPRYPEDLVKRIVAGSSGSDVLDAGCGTGIAARQFQAVGCTVLGVEPDERMANLARQLGVEVEVATFEDWDPAGRQYDLVVAAQAWHWIDPVAGAAKAAQVLRPGGRLAPVWNVFQFPPDAAEAFTEVFLRVMPDSKFDHRAIMSQAMDGYQVLFDKAANGIREAGGFGDPEQWRSDWEWTYTRDTWLDQMPTFANFTGLPADKLDKLLENIGAAVDTLGGSFTMRYATVAVTAARTGTS